MSIMEVLRTRELKAIQRSVNGREHFEQRVASRADYVKDIISGDNPNAGVPVEVVALRDLYGKMLESYTREKSFAAARMNAKSVALWTRAEKARERSGASQERFLKAQFDWFHKTFGRAPEPLQLTTDAAVERALSFGGRTEGRVVSNNIKHKTSMADVFRQNEKLLQQMMAAQGCTREEFYRKFVITGIYSFSPEFLKADPAYRRVLENG